MKKIILALLISIGLAWAVTAFAQNYTKYACTSSSTQQQCQDAVNLDTLQQQLMNAEALVQTRQQQLQAAQATVQTQLQQAIAAQQLIQSQITSNEQDYQAQALQAQYDADTAQLTAIQSAVAVKQVGASTSTPSVNGT